MNKITKYLFLIILLNSCLNTNNRISKNIEYFNSILVDIKVSDTLSGKFILDTGSPITVLDSSFVAENSISLTCVDSIEIFGMGSSVVKSFTYENIDISAFEKRIGSQFIVVQNLKKIIPIEDGIIGIDFFKNNIISLDYEKEQISIIANTSELENSYRKIPVQIENDRIFVYLEIQINDKISVKGWFMLDTGSEYAVTLYSSTTDSLGLYNMIDKKIELTTKNGGLGGDVKRFFIKAQNTKIENFEIDNIILDCSTNKNKILSNNSEIGSIGNLILEKFTVIFDLPNNSIYLKPNKSYKQKFVYFRSGISLGRQVEDGFFIKNVIKEFLHSEIEILQGDVLLSIDDLNVIKIGYIETRKLLREKGSHKIVIRRGIDIYETKIMVEDVLLNL